MIEVELCVGSSCHVKGSNQLVAIVKEMIIANDWENKVLLKGSFCMQKCQLGLNVRVDGVAIEGFGIHNIEDELINRIKAGLHE